MKITIHDIQDTLFLRKESDGLKQLIDVSIHSSFPKSVHGIMRLNFAGQKLDWELSNINTGQSIHKVFIPELTDTANLEVRLEVGGTMMDCKKILLTPSKHWQVHIVQLSHHDLGYTGLPSNVLSKHARYLDKAIDMAEVTESYPDDAKFRLTIEQAWSVNYFLKKASPERAEKLIKLMQSGQFELTALFGNMITELCGHESLIRTLYPSYRIKKKYNIPIISAEHNDITGISWGLCRLLTDMDIKIFCPGLPLYYDWAEGVKYQSFWNQKAVFGYDNAPGAFWWEAATGKRLLFWCNNSGCGGSTDPSLPGLEEALKNLETKNYQSSVFRWPVHGGDRDNSPYTANFANTIKNWNEKWAFPHLICSTNARFYEEFSKTDLSRLPVHRGELPGQDYPVGATSTARTTALNRNNHQSLLSAEKLAIVASELTDYEHQSYEIEQAYENTLCFEEHVWGHTFSHGPAMDGAEAEKSLSPYRTAAYAHDVIQKSAANIADNIRKDEEGIYLVVFNALSQGRSDVLRIPMREFENSEIVMENDNGILRGKAIAGRKDRGHLPLPEEFINGNFEIVDTDSQKAIPYQIIEISADDTIPYAGQRVGLAAGRKEYFNYPAGLNLDLCFYAKNIPAMGYKTYYLRPAKNTKCNIPKANRNATNYIENEFYRISINQKSSEIAIFDKKSNKNMLDSEAFHKFGDVIARNPVTDFEENILFDGQSKILAGEIYSSIKRRGAVFGHPSILQTLTLYKDVKRVDFDIRILKDSTPLRDVHVAFPFAVSTPKFSYEGTLNILRPIEDFLPEAYSDRLAIQNWVTISNDKYSILWCSHDAPLVSMSELWPGYISPAHSCVQSKKLLHPPLKKEDFKTGWIYSNIFNNNFCTNFSITQSGEYLFRYSFTTQPVLSVEQAMCLGTEILTPVEHIFTSSDYQSNLPLKQSFIEIENDKVVLLNCKKADDDSGIVMRFWNVSDEKVNTTIHCSFTKIKNVYMINHAEELIGKITDACSRSFILEINTNNIRSVLIQND